MRGFAHPVQYSWGRMCSAAGRGVFRVILAWLGQPFAACPRGVAGDPGFDGLCLFTFACAMQWPWACRCVLSFCFHSGSELVPLPAGFESRMACNVPYDIALRGVWLSASCPLPGERSDSPRNVSDPHPQSFHCTFVGRQADSKSGSKLGRHMSSKHVPKSDAN